MTKQEGIEREKKIVELLKKGYSYKDIAYELRLTYQTVYSFCQSRYLIKDDYFIEDKNINKIIETTTIEQSLKILNWTPYKLNKYKFKFGIKNNRGRNKKHEDIISDYKLGMKQIDIANKFNVSKQYVSALVLKEKKDGKKD